MEPTTPPVDLLTSREEKTLARAIEAGVIAEEARRRGAADPDLQILEELGARAWHWLAQANSRLVWLVALPAARRTGIDADELFQEGYLGLLEAMLRFDHRREARFATFALPWIRMRVSNASATNLGSVGLPAGRAKAWRRVRAVASCLEAASGRQPTDAQVAAASGDEVTTVGRLRQFEPPAALSADQEVALPVPDEAESWLGHLGPLVRALPPLQREVVQRRYGLGAHPAMTLQEAALALGVSPSTVRRRELEALAALRGQVARVAA